MNALQSWTPNHHTLFGGPFAAVAAYAVSYRLGSASLQVEYISAEAVQALARAVDDKPLLVVFGDDCDIPPDAAAAIREVPPGPLVFIASEPIDGLTDGWDCMETQDSAGADGRPWGVLTPADGSPAIRVPLGGR